MSDQVLEEIKELQSNYCLALTQLKSLRSKHRQVEKENDKNLRIYENLERQMEISAGKKYFTFIITYPYSINIFNFTTVLT